MTVKVKAPIGYHFMVRETDNDFYLMKTHFKGYVKHTSGEYASALEIDVEVKGQHIPSGTTQRTSVSTSSRLAPLNNAPPIVMISSSSLSMFIY